MAQRFKAPSPVCAQVAPSSLDTDPLACTCGESQEAAGNGCDDVGVVGPGIERQMVMRCREKLREKLYRLVTPNTAGRGVGGLAPCPWVPVGPKTAEVHGLRVCH